MKREVNFGTVKPFFVIGKAPFAAKELSDNDKKPRYFEILSYLNNLTEKFSFNEEIKKFWEHIKSIKGKN